MDEPVGPSTVSKGSLRRCTRIKLRHVALAIPMFCLTGGWVTNVLTQKQARAAVDLELAKLKKMGIPLTPEDMVRTVPPAENAAPIYDRAIIVFKSIAEPKLSGFRSPKSTASELAQHRKLVLKHAPTLKLIEEAARKPFCDWNRDWSLGPFLMFPEHGSLSGFAKLIASKAYLESELGDFESAFRWLEIGRRVARHAREPGRLWVSVRCEQEILAEFQHLLNEHGDSARFRLLAHKFLANLGSLPSLREDVNGDVVSARVALKGLAEARPGFEMNSVSHGGPSYEDQAVTYSMRLGSVRTSVEARVLKHFRQQIEAMSARTYAEQQHRAIALDQHMESDRSWYGRIAGFFSPSFERASAAYVRLDANRRLCRSALELWDLKAASGTFPMAFSKGIDPFTDKPFLYKKTGRGFKLYSLGPNMKDDGGAPKDYSIRSDDVEFCPPPR